MDDMREYLFAVGHREVKKSPKLSVSQELQKEKRENVSS